MLGAVTGWIAGLVGGIVGRPTLDRDAVRLVDAYVWEASARQSRDAAQTKVQSYEAGHRILEATPEQRARIATAAFLALCDSASARPVWRPRSYQRSQALRDLVSRLLRTRLPLASDDLQVMLRAANRTTYWTRLPWAGLLRATERFTDENGLDAALVGVLQALHWMARNSGHADMEKIADRIEALLGGGQRQTERESGPFAQLIWPALAALDAPARAKWQAVLRHADTLADRSRPPAKWLTGAEPLVAALGVEAFAERIETWLGAPDLNLEPWEPDANRIRGLIFMAILVPRDRLAVTLGRFCELCYRKIPGIGARSMKLGNACLHALGRMGERGVAELVRLRGRMRYVQARQRLEKALSAAAGRAGLSVADLEEIALPDFGLGPDGSLTETLGEATAEIRITGSDTVALFWTGADGRLRKSVPAAVKEHHQDALKELRAKVKEIRGMLAGQRYRLESLYLRDRSWPTAQWRERYLEHPLLANMTRRLIWTFGGTAMVPAGGRFVDVDGAAVEPPQAETVSLWHPIGVAAEEVLAWRRRLAALEITQPFKQAHREIYVLTDAERETRTYSNRFAAHILRQHQFSALCRERGWRYTLQGDWDSHNVPERRLAERGIAVKFSVDPIDPENQTGSGIYNYVTTDRVAFHDGAGNMLDLADVPPLLFSELMRDVDLFVGVCSIGNDPEWQDRGPEGAFMDYWQGYSSGELTETAETRRAVLAELLPRLKIADACTLEDRFLVVRGTKRTYRIHLGSANIQMEPNNQYLCIVPGRHEAGGEPIRLPFEGDRALAVILSKAFLLAADDKIADETILSQIGG
ncbi:MAG: DUF4132 domain-containing protein [Alphaproteobacteria bacterium]|nr:DUF4132 domain-containing protein [Alphaproteobacteria bacterium]